MGAASGQDVSFKAMLTLGWLALACLPGATSTGEPLAAPGTSCLSGNVRLLGAGEGVTGQGQGGWALAGPCYPPTQASLVLGLCCKPQNDRAGLDPGVPHSASTRAGHETQTSGGDRGHLGSSGSSRGTLTSQFWPIAVMCEGGSPLRDLVNF